MTENSNKVSAATNEAIQVSLPIQLIGRQTHGSIAAAVRRKRRAPSFSVLSSFSAFTLSLYFFSPPLLHHHHLGSHRYSNRN